MDDIHTLYIKKSDTTVNTFAQWGIVCCKPPFHAGGETKDLPKREWFDEHGEDTYLPSRLFFKSYDEEFELAYKGSELATNPFDLDLAFTQINNFKLWLSGNDLVEDDEGSGSSLKIYSPYTTIGRQGMYLLSFSEEDPVVMTKYEDGNDYHENVVTFKVKFRVTDPMTNITLP
jgi:hypothetical protein